MKYLVDMSFGPTTLLIRSSTALAASVDGETVMLDPTTSRYFGLEATGARIWELLETPKSQEQLVAALIEEYEVEPETCRAEVSQFLEVLDAAGLLAPAD
jgi:hypothetical protein